MSLADITSTYRCKLIIATYKGWLRRKSKVLDVGCGNGIVLARLKKHFNVIVTGCDIINYLKYDIPYVEMGLEDKLPFKKKIFDIVMFNDVLHHMELKNQKKLIQEALRIADNVLIFEVQPTYTGKIFDYVLNKIHNPIMRIPLTFRSTEAWIILFKTLGVNYKIRYVKKPFFYPFLHIAFCINKKVS